MTDAGGMLDIAWIAICTVLVVMMQAGFSALESGFIRAKNSINVAAKNLADFCLSSLLFWVFGFGLMFGPSAAGWVGTGDWLFGDGASPYQYAFFLFQLAFCGTATTIVSGAVAERMRFQGYLIAAAVTAAVIYPLAGHWAWATDSDGNPAGWLGRLGFIDFAGSTVVHSVGGWVALAALLLVGPRFGRFRRTHEAIEGHNVPLSMLGVLFLWIGWFGFNGGSTLALDRSVPLILVNTALGGAAGGIAAIAYGWIATGRPDIRLMANGPIAGLVGVTASCNIVTSTEAVVIGAAAGLIGVWATIVLERLRIDDAVGAVPAHLAAGIWGTLAVALFGDTAAFGGADRLTQLGIQALGVAVIGAYAFGTSLILLAAASRLVPLRVSPRQEIAGLNITEHGASTAINDLLYRMERQRRRGDFSKPVPVEPHTEAGRIARQYNQVLRRFNAETERREQANKELGRAKESAETANQAKSQFLAKMSHELRTPLNAVIGFAELLTERDIMQDETRRRDYASDILASGRHLLALVNDILDLSKIETRAFELKEEPVDVADLVLSVCRVVSPASDKKGLKLRCSASSDLPVMVADRRAMRQVLLNLLSNAIKFTPAPGRITVAALIETDGRMALSVADTGVGMAHEDIPRAMEPFTQIGDTLNTHTGGTGLGLPLARSLVALHRGTMVIQSEPGRGTTVTVRMPEERLVGGSASAALAGTVSARESGSTKAHRGPGGLVPPPRSGPEP